MKYRLSVSVGDDLRSVVLTERQWKDVSEGRPLVKRVKDYYEGEQFTYVFGFNMHPEYSLNVAYDDAEGYLGSVEDAVISKVE